LASLHSRDPASFGVDGLPNLSPPHPAGPRLPRPQADRSSRPTPAMAAPVTRQVSGCAGPILTPTGSDTEPGQPLATAVADLPVLDASGRRVSFGALFRERRAVVVFVRHFLCYVCKEYVEDLAKIPKSFLRMWMEDVSGRHPDVDEADVTLIVIGQSSYRHIEPFCKLTGYSHEIYVDPEREIYKRLGMKRGEEISSSGKTFHMQCSSLKYSLWRAVTGPLFDFQGDPAQQGGTFILGPGNSIHFVHRDRNRLDHKPINSVLQLVGVQPVNFMSRPAVIHV
ncbi:hypothetical protein U0070_027609, partial [Myodes glareolus]